VALTRLIPGTLTLLVVGGLAAGCAKEGFPPGGPVDDVPPAVLATIPASGELGVDRGQPIIFRFSEPMEHTSVERALFFTPDLSQLLRISWHGSELRLNPRAPLRENTTFVVTLGADAADLRRNRMGTSHTLAFSTGTTLDDASVSGQVFEEGAPVKGAWVWVYPVGTEEEKAQADPALASREVAPVLPLYVFQTDDAGRFEAGHLAQGDYRVFAFRDADNRRFWEGDREPLAVPPQDVVFTSPDDRLSGLNLNLAPRDTIGPAVRSATARGRDWVQLTLSEPCDPAWPVVAGLEPFVPEGEPPPAGGSEPRVVRAYTPAAAPAALVLQVEGLEAGRRYAVRLIEGRDVRGNRTMPADRPVTFAASALPDTVTPAILQAVPADSSRGLGPEQGVLVTFSSPIDTTGLAPWSLTGPDTLALVRTWIDPLTMRLVPVRPPRPEGWYHLLLPAGGLHSWTGRSGPAVADTMVWQGVEARGRGTLRFNLEADPLPPGGACRVVITGLDRASSSHTELSPVPGPVTTPPLAVGAYRIWGFLDRDGDGRPGLGSIRPFEPAEPLGAISDTLYVRESFESTVSSTLVLRAPQRPARAVPPPGASRPPERP
jgi:hypothetical protein